MHKTPKLPYTITETQGVMSCFGVVPGIDIKLRPDLLCPPGLGWARPASRKRQHGRLVAAFLGYF
jgi:hypothetical protein